MTAVESRRYHWQILVSWPIERGEQLYSYDDTFESAEPVYRSEVRQEILTGLIQDRRISPKAIVRFFDVQPDLVGGCA